MQFDLFDDGRNRILETRDYAAFRRALAESGCARCALHQGRHHIVVDRGNPQAAVLLIGEAPGEQEDLEGEAFVGRAGRLLDELVREVGLDTNRDMLIANVVKCRPPENRAPRQEEVDACSPFLKRQIAIQNPQVIVLLGATALKHLITDKKAFSMSEEAGKIFRHPDFPGRDFMVLYHPAYLLYDPRKRPDMQAHLAALRRHLASRGLVGPLKPASVAPAGVGAAR